MRVTDRFLKYVSYDTQSDASSPAAPSTAKQLILADELKKELEELGLDSVIRDSCGIVYGILEPNTDKKMDSIGFIAHMDTASELSGKDVRPQIIENWDGSTIKLNDHVSMNPKDFPELARVVGDTLVVTDGTTLLGADDKAGIAIIMQMLEELIASKKEHGRVLVAFTPDEEIGRGVENFNLEQFPADYAFTVDGGNIEEIDYETFNAASAHATISGKAIHPGSAKDQMINAVAIAAELASMLPGWMKPEHTENREGFIHLISMEGNVDHADAEWIIRDHDHDLFEHKKVILKNAAAYLNTIYNDCIHLEIHDQYRNMKDYMNGDFTSVEKARKALKEEGLSPRSNAIRGGTDGAMLTVRGLNTPNLGTGGGNCHGRYEFASVNEMEKMVQVLHRIVEDR